MSERLVRIGVIGAGGFAEQCHIPGIRAHPQGEVVALCARTAERVTAMARRLGVPEVYSDYRELLAQPEIDAVTVATPDAAHLPVTLAALEAGKHVFCDKPLAMNVAEARRMVEAAQRSGLVNMVAFTFRYAIALRTLRRLIAEGAAGTPFYVSMQVHWGGIGFPDGVLTWREQAGQSAAGIWGDGASHLFDALAFVLAPPEEVCAQMMVVPRGGDRAQPDNPDLVTCLARLRLPGAADGELSGYADRVPGVVQVSILTSRVDAPRGGGDGITVVGTRGAVDITLTRGQHERVSLRRAGERAWEDVHLPEEATGDAPLACARMLGAFIDGVLRGRLEPGDPDFAAGLRAQQALEAALRSTQTSCWEKV